MIDWDARLSQVARQQAKALRVDLPEPAADDLHRRLQERTNLKLRMTLALFHAQAREGVAKALRKALAAGSLLVEEKTRLGPEAFAALVKGANITPGTAANYMRAAERAPDLAARCRLRRTRHRCPGNDGTARFLHGDSDRPAVLPDAALPMLVDLCFGDHEEASDVAGR